MKIIKTSNIIIFNEEYEVLLVKRANRQDEPGLWSLPGGTNEGKESLEDTLKREIKEELGCTLSSYSFFKLYLMNINNNQIETNYYTGTIKGHIKLNTKELSQYKWFKQNEIPENLAYNQNKILDDFLR